MRIWTVLRERRVKRDGSKTERSDQARSPQQVYREWQAAWNLGLRRNPHSLRGNGRMVREVRRPHGILRTIHGPFRFFYPGIMRRPASLGAGSRSFSAAAHGSTGLMEQPDPHSKPAARSARGRISRCQW